MVSITLIQIEAVQVVGHRTIEEGRWVHTLRYAVGAAMISVLICSIVILHIIAVHDTVRSGVICHVRIVEDRFRGLGIRAGSSHPAVLHIAATLFGNTGTGERACDAEVIHLAAEVAEERAGETADGIAVAMQHTVEALGRSRLVDIGGLRIIRYCIFADRSPCVLRTLVALQDELQILTSTHLTGIQCRVSVRTFTDTKIKQVFQQVEAALAARRIVAVIVDINLRIAVHILVVNIIVVVLGLHHLLQVMVVGHIHLYRIRIALTADVGQTVVAHVVVVLIPVERVQGWRERNGIASALSIFLSLIQLPATASNLVGTRNDVRLAQAYIVARNDNLRSLDILHLGQTTLERDMDIHHMAFADRRDVVAQLVALLVVVTVNHGDNLLRRQVLDIREAADIECRGLHRGLAVNGEVQLFVDQMLVGVRFQAIIGTLSDDKSHGNRLIVRLCIANSTNAIHSNNSLDRLTAAFLTHRVALTTIIIGAC